MLRLILTTLYTWRARQTPIFLGRWKLKYEEQLANEDNCGCCEIDLPKFDDNMGDDYYLPYVI